MLTKLAIWYLRKRKESVLIGFEIKGGYVRSLNPHTKTYDNRLYGVDYRMYDNQPLTLPSGKFSIRS